ncbi:MAG: hypothetical protein QM786_02770 [Breznakibacter sp.]
MSRLSRSIPSILTIALALVNVLTLKGQAYHFQFDNQFTDGKNKIIAVELFDEYGKTISAHKKMIVTNTFTNIKDQFNFEIVSTEALRTAEHLRITLKDFLSGDSLNALDVRDFSAPMTNRHY